jgi:two-component system, LytTR family, response regulator
MKVVIVDDEWFGLDIIYRVLTQIRHDLETVSFFQDPKEALEKIPFLNPDLIILDYEMPYMSGFELYEKLKEMNSNFLIVSAHSDTYIRKQAWKENVGILTKPFCKSDMSFLLNEMSINKG